MNESSIYRNVSYYIIILYRIILSFTYFLQLHLFSCNINCMISLTSFAILYFSPDSHWREIHSWPKISKAFYNRLENFFDTFSFFVLVFREISMGSYFKLFPFCLIQAKIFIEKRKKKEKEEMKVVKIILDSNQLLLLLARFVRELAPLFRFPSAPTLFLLFSSPLAMDLLNYVWLTVKVHPTGEIGVGISARTTFGSKRIGFVLKLGLEKRRNENSLTFCCLILYAGTIT